MAFVVRPVFVGWIAILVQLPIQLFMTFWAGGFLGGISSAALGVHGRVPFVVFGALGFVVIPCIAYFGKKLKLRPNAIHILRRPR